MNQNSKIKKNKNQRVCNEKHISTRISHILLWVMQSKSHSIVIYNRHLDSLNRHCSAIFSSPFGESYIL